MKELTESQLEMLTFIVRFYQKYDNLPTTRTIAANFNFWQTAAQQQQQKIVNKGAIFVTLVNKQKVWRLNRDHPDVIKLLSTPILSDAENTEVATPIAPA